MRAAVCVTLMPMGWSPAKDRGTAVVRVARAAGQLVWMLIPVLSLSFLSFVPAVQVYWRARTLGWLITAAALLIASAVVGVGMAVDAEGAGFGFIIIGAAGGGVAAAAAGRRIVFDDQGPEVDPAVERVLEERQRREQAREIVVNDPAMAFELGIGRPDLSGAYADGGLVDLNNTTAGGIVQVLGWDPVTAETFVAERDARHGYASLTEIGALSGLDPKLLDTHAERIVVLPYRQHG